MGARLLYCLVVILIFNGQLRCTSANDVFKNEKLMLTDDLNHPDHNNRAILIGQGTEIKLKEDAAVPVKSTEKSPSTPLPTPQEPSIGSATFTVPTMPQPATATMSPGGKDVSKIINLLFAILLVATAILMAITGFCMMGLRRRYLIVSEQPRYEKMIS